MTSTGSPYAPSPFMPVPVEPETFTIESLEIVKGVKYLFILTVPSEPGMVARAKVWAEDRLLKGIREFLQGDELATIVTLPRNVTLEVKRVEP